ncbi:MAG: hypothetical protein IIC90_12025 [Chloroflexi bacterium]|nr:hypothetical protein [Chloroflexota bacterium]
MKCRTTVVNGWGNSDASYVFVGQNPGQIEDEQGRPFIGRSGHVLATLVRSVNIDVDDIFLTNASRCLTPGNRPPKKEEYAACNEYLLEELAAVNPDVIVILGAVALKSLVGNVSLDAVMGTTLVHETLGKPMITTYHPAYVLRGQWHAVPLILEHFDKAKRIVEGTQTIGTMGEYTTIKTIRQLKLLRDYLLASPIIHLDTETTGTDWKNEELLCISFSVRPGEGYVVPILQQGRTMFWSDKDHDVAMEIIGEILASPVPKALQNAGFDIRFLERESDPMFSELVTTYGWHVRNFREDTMLANRLVREYLPKEAKPNELPRLLAIHTDMPEYEAELKQQSKNKAHMDEVENETLWHYAAADADALPRLLPKLRADLDADGDSPWIYENISIPMVRACQNMSRRGVLVDMQWFTRLATHYEERHDELKKQTFEIVGHEFNPNATQQVQEILFDELGLPKSGRKTDKSKECLACEEGDCTIHDQVGKDALLAIKADQDHPIIDLLIDIKQVYNWRSKYLTGAGGKAHGFLEHIRRDGRVHAEFKVGVAETGRLSSANPNMQNIPKNVEIEFSDGVATLNAFRQSFVAPPDHVLMEVDWSQLEVWVMAYTLYEQHGDKTMLEILLTGRDIHTVVGRTIWPIDLELDEYEWSKEHPSLRDDAKVFTFGISYGLTVEGIMERLHCDKTTAQALLSAYLTMVPGLREYREEIRSTIRAGDPLINKFGRRRHFPQVATMIECNARFDLEELFREGDNYPIQSGGSELQSLAHIKTEHHPALQELFRIVVAVHDSCLGEVPAPNLSGVLDTAWKLKDLWQTLAREQVLADGSVLGWEIPVEIKWGTNWGDMKYVLTAKGGLLYNSQPVNTDNMTSLPVA